jgi:hypothetical protein
LFFALLLDRKSAGGVAGTCSQADANDVRKPTGLYAINRGKSDDLLKARRAGDLPLRFAPIETKLMRRSGPPLRADIVARVVLYR